MDLRKLYLSGDNIKFDDIPENWRKNFNDFMIGQTCLLDDNGKEIVYSHDFRVWYHLNKKAIERNIKIDDVVKK